MMDFCDYVGLPYKEGGDTVEGFNCWGLLRHIQRVHFGVILPAVPIGDAAACVEWFTKASEDQSIIELAWPKHGANVLLRGGARPHVGVYLEVDGGGVLHALEGVGVVFTNAYDLKLAGYTRVKYYSYQDVRSTHLAQEPVPGSP